MSPGRAPAWAAHHLLTLYTQTSLNWGKPQPCSIFRAICAIPKSQSAPGIPVEMGLPNCPLAIKTIGVHLEAPVTSMVFLRDSDIGFLPDHAWCTRLRWGACPCHHSQMAPWMLLTHCLFWASLPRALPLLIGGYAWKDGVAGSPANALSQGTSTSPSSSSSPTHYFTTPLKFHSSTNATLRAQWRPSFTKEDALGTYREPQCENLAVNCA